MASAASRARALGEFLRSARARLSPADVGLPEGVRRRTPGLRREELAQLCDISATWYTWIEQGRDISVSPTVWARLAQALRLSRAERHYLFDLAEAVDPDGPQAQVDPLPQGLEACVHAIATPAYILDRCWNVLACNAAFKTLFWGWPDTADATAVAASSPAGALARPVDSLGAAASTIDGHAQRPGRDPDGQAQPPNLLRYIFLDPRARRHVVDWETRASRVVAEFRADAGLHLEEPDVRALLAQLQQESPLFAYWWTRHAVVEREGGLRAFHAPDQRTLLRHVQFTFRLATRPDCKLVILLPASGAEPG